MHYRDFVLRVERSSGGFQAEVLASPGGEGQRHAFDFRLDTGPLHDAIGRLTQARRARRDIAVTGGHADGDDPTKPLAMQLARHVGGCLFDQVIAGSVREALDRSLGLVERDGAAGLRLRLRLDRVPELAELPWELLFDARDGRFLATSDRTPIVRYLELDQPVERLAVQSPLRVLVVVSDPDDYADLAGEREWRNMRRALAELDDKVEVDRLSVATPEALGAALAAQPCHVLHFIGHGDFDTASGEGVLLFEDARGRGLPVGAARLGAMLGEHPTLRLVVLNACEGARSASDDAFAGVAQRIMRAGVPAAIAMQYPISDAAAVMMARDLYQALADLYPIDVALARARQAIFEAQVGIEWSIPVLFMRAPDGQLFRDAEVPEFAFEPTARPAQPESIEGFVGREQDVSEHLRELRRERVAVIAGMAGTGKTWLAIRLAQALATPERRLWYRYADRGADDILEALALFLYWNGQTGWWERRESDRRARRAPEAFAAQVATALDMLAGRDYVLLFDDLELPKVLEADERGKFGELFGRLSAAAGAGDLTLIVTARRAPKFVERPTIALGGMTPADVRALLGDAKVDLTDDLLARLHERTEGNPQLLRMAIAALRGGRDPARLIEGLEGKAQVEGAIEEYLWEQVDEQLSEPQRGVMYAVAVLLGAAGSRPAIEAVLADRGWERRVLWRATQDLAGQHLLSVTEAEGGRLFGAHALVREFYYRVLDDAERRAMHVHAGEFYASTEPDALTAARHFARGGAHERAAALATEDVWDAAESGRGYELLMLLRAFRADQVSPLAWAKVKTGLAMIAEARGENAEAEASFGEALGQIRALPSSDAVGEMELDAMLGLTNVLQHRSPAEAARYLGGFEDRFARGGGAWPAKYHVRMAQLRTLTGEIEDAREAVDRGLAIADVGASLVRIDGLTAKGVILETQGDLEQALHVTTDALIMARKAQDWVRVLNLELNLAVVEEKSDRLDDAERRYLEAWKLAERLGIVEDQVLIRNNLGSLYTTRGQYEAAAAQLDEALAMARRYGLREWLVTVLSSVGDLAIHTGDMPAARRALEEAKGLAEELGGREDLGFIEEALGRVELTEAVRGATVGARGAVLLSRGEVEPDLS